MLQSNMLFTLSVTIPLVATAAKWEWELVELRHQHKENVTSATYFSQAFDLKPGGFIFTDSDETPVEFPRDSPYAITGFRGEIVYAATNESVPLSKVYDHHWVVSHTGFVNPFCPNGPTYVFGIGAESRNTPVEFPAGYGYRVAHPGIYWGANIHCLRTEYLAGDDPHAAIKECNECYYAPGKGCLPRENGTFSCCGDRDHAAHYGCQASDSAPTESETYRLRYTLDYADHDAVAEARVGVITTPHCETFYQVYGNESSPEQLSSASFRSPFDLEVLVALGHQHVGAINISLFVNDVFVCASYPTYGTEDDVAGNERGYLVQMSTCFEKDGNLRLVIRKHDTVRLDSWYWASADDPRIAPIPGGTHLNVMGYMYVIFSAEVDETPWATAE